MSLSSPHFLPVFSNFFRPSQIYIFLFRTADFSISTFSRPLDGGNGAFNRFVDRGHGGGAAAAGILQRNVHCGRGLAGPLPPQPSKGGYSLGSHGRNDAVYGPSSVRGDVGLGVCGMERRAISLAAAVQAPMVI